MISTKKIEYQMQRNLVTNQELAEKTGLSAPTISKIRSGAVKNPRPGNIRKLCIALNCKPEDILETAE